LGLQHIQGGLRTGPPGVDIRANFARHLPRVGGMRGGLAPAVDVGGERHVAKLREFLGPLLRVIIESPPFMHHQHARAGAFDGVIPGEIALAFGVTCFVGNGFGLNGGLSETRESENHRKGQDGTDHG
jgi:hypothetical protein